MDKGWLQDATVEDIQPLVEQAWREVTVPGGYIVARKAVTVVMQAFRTPDLANPAAFVDMAVGALEDFPAIVLAELASPKIGIVRGLKFPPTIAELVQWCEDRLAKHKETANGGNRVVQLRISAKLDAEWKVQEAASRAKAQAEWEAGAPERKRKAEEAERLVRAAALKQAAEEAAQKREREARAAWMKAIFTRFVDDAAITEKLCSLTDEEQDEATRRELQMPGAGSQWLAERVTQ